MSNIKNIPEKIYLQIGDECPDDADFNELSEVSWCKDKIYDNDIEFTLQNKVSEKCKHKSLADTGAGYYYCPDCDYRWTYSEYEEEENEVSDISAEAVLKKWFLTFKKENPSENMMSWEEAQASPEMEFYLKAMEEYASIVNEKQKSDISIAKFSDDKIDATFPVSNDMPEKGQLYNSGKRLGAKWMKNKLSIVNERKDNVGSDKSFLNVLIENYEASKRMGKWVLQREILIETYQDLIDIYKANYLQDQLKNNNVGVNDAIEFAEWIRTFEMLEKKHGHWVLDCQISSKELYKIFQESQPKEESEKELEERTERNMNVISDFCEHVKSETNFVIPESAVLSFFNA